MKKTQLFMSNHLKVKQKTPFMFKHEKTDKLPRYLLNCEEREFNFGKNTFINFCVNVLQKEGIVQVNVSRQS